MIVAHDGGVWPQTRRGRFAGAKRPQIRPIFRSELTPAKLARNDALHLREDYAQVVGDARKNGAGGDGDEAGQQSVFDHVLTAAVFTDALNEVADFQIKHFVTPFFLVCAARDRPHLTHVPKHPLRSGNRAIDRTSLSSRRGQSHGTWAVGTVSAGTPRDLATERNLTRVLGPFPGIPGGIPSRPSKRGGQPCYKLDRA